MSHGLLRPLTFARFDDVVDAMQASPLSVEEADVLEAHLWSRGEDGFLREDRRFRQTPWGRWILSSRFLANDEVVQRLRNTSGSAATLKTLLSELALQVHCEGALCSADPRLVVSGDRVRLAATELSDDVMVGDAADSEQFTTHLPLHTLKAVAASEPRGEWGKGAQDTSIETIGWVRVDVRKKLNERMFVAEVQGESMDDGKSGLVDGGYAIFELWPAGTKQDLVVLARGAFKDPETGAFAVKKYKADARGADGTHQSIRLVSLNPDKARFPDIVLAPERDDDVTVVAKLVAALPRAALARKPRAATKVAGRRDTASAAGRQAIASRLQDFAAEMLSAPTADAGTADTVATARTSAARPAELICLGDHLALELGPVAIPPFAKQLKLVGDADDIAVVGANVRTARRRLRVSPSVQSWTWQAPGIDVEMLADELASMTVVGLPADQATAFRVDGGGVGRRRPSAVLSPGETWRIVVPPGLPGEGRALANGWRLVEVDLGETIPLDLAALLTAWGLQVRPAHPHVVTRSARPIRWIESKQGDLVPVYAEGSPIEVIVDGMTTLFPGELTAFVASPGATAHLALPVGSAWRLAVQDAPSGPLCIEATPTRTASDLERACFSVEAGAPRLPAAALSVVVQDAALPLGTDGELTVVEPFPGLLEVDAALTLHGPPLWPIWIRIETPGFRGFTSGACDELGVLDVREVLEGWRATWEGRPFAELRLDAGELGVVTFKHRGRRTVANITEALGVLVSQRLAAVPQLRADLALYDDQWVKPLLRLLGYEVEVVSLEGLADVPTAARAYLLFEWHTDDATPKREISRVCVVVSHRDGLEPLFIAGAHAFADKLCATHGVRESLVTDGLIWTEHRRGSSLRRPKFWDIAGLVKAGSTKELEELLNELAVGV